MAKIISIWWKRKHTKFIWENALHKRDTPVISTDQEKICTSILKVEEHCHWCAIESFRGSKVMHFYFFVHVLMYFEGDKFKSRVNVFCFYSILSWISGLNEQRRRYIKFWYMYCTHPCNLLTNVQRKCDKDRSALGIRWESRMRKDRQIYYVRVIREFPNKSVLISVKIGLGGRRRVCRELVKNLGRG